ncbi:MAG TPA: A/G-specific adenine glycosylase [Thermoanaerobaculia bacterium]|nr:A/G-specific adenine glycosylase [Thermoanaerobaculia bacterium]
MRQDLLQWFDRHRRDLPWRRTRDPYAIWLSEVMLQQTRVETVLPYYQRFLDRFPTVEDLARAEIDEVLALWSGLGYYRRARQLHAAARQVAELGGFPRTAEGLLQLPGIGAYTAAAVASIAFGEAAPVLDGNVERVMARRLGMAEDPKGSAGRKKLLAAAAELLDPGRPGDSNQALMELGATLCSPRRPKCLLCPLAGGCVAAAEGDPERYPMPRRRREPERHRLVVAVVEEEGKVLLFRRPEESTLLAGTWELPWTEAAEAEPPEAALASRYGGRWALGPAAAAVRHGITHRDLEIEVRRARLVAGDRVGEGLEAGWFDAQGRAALPLSSLVGKVLGALAEAASPTARRRQSRRRR